MKIANRALAPALLLALLSGCTVLGPAKFTGGGTMPSAGGAQKAVLTVNGDTCGSEPKGRITYDDRSSVDFESVGGVSLRADVLKAGLCLGIDPNNPTFQECTCPAWPAMVADYTSTNPAAPGSGKLYACFMASRDQTLHGSDKHIVRVQEVRLVGGPFDKYINTGILDGNIQTHACKTP